MILAVLLLKFLLLLLMLLRPQQRLRLRLQNRLKQLLLLLLLLLPGLLSVLWRTLIPIRGEFFIESCCSFNEVAADVGADATPLNAVSHDRLQQLRKHEWFIQSCCATTGDGLYEGLEWCEETVAGIRSGALQAVPQSVTFSHKAVKQSATSSHKTEDVASDAETASTAATDAPTLDVSGGAP